MRNFNIWLIKTWSGALEEKNIKTVRDYKIEVFKAWFVSSIIVFALLPCFLYGLKLGLVDNFYSSLSMATDASFDGFVFAMHLSMLFFGGILTLALGLPPVLIFTLSFYVKLYEEYSPRLINQMDKVSDKILEFVSFYKPMMKMIKLPKVKFEIKESKKLDPELIKKLN